MKMIDPTYLRTIHDGLHSGALHKDNASGLPLGLVGMYEEALPPASNVNERKRFLEFFSIWALLKKEVSAAFVVPLLETWTEQQALEYIGRYSKWFNSPVSGKYTLYHESFRCFLLARMTKIVNQNIRLLNSILSQSESSSTNQVEYLSYLQSYYGDHLALASYFKTDEDTWYGQLRMLDSKIEKSKWNVSFSDRTRWNSLAATLAAIEVDEPFLEDIILSQDRLSNTPVNFDYFVNTILEGAYHLLDEHLLYTNNELEKGVFVLVLIHRFRSLIDKNIANTKSDRTFVNSRKIENILNELIKRLNTAIQSGVWIAAEDYLYSMNIMLKRFSSTWAINVDAIVKPEPDGDVPYDLIDYGPIKIDDLIMYSTDFIENYNEDKKSLKNRVLGSLNDIVSEAVEPGYAGNPEDIKKLRDAIEILNADIDFSEVKVIDLLNQIKEMLALTSYSDYNYDFNQHANYIIRDCIIFGSSDGNHNWLQCYVNPISYRDTVMYYHLIKNIMQTKSIRKDLLFNNRWSSRDLFLAAANSTVQMLYAKGKKAVANKLQNEAMEYYMNYQITDRDALRTTYKLQVNSLKPKEILEIELSFRKMDFNHNPTLAYLLCKKYSFLNLASFLWYDDAHLRGVSENKLWAHEIIKGIVLKLGAEKSYDYFIAGIDQYVSVMGAYESDAYDRESNRPEGNIWKLEWWVISNFVVAYEEFMNKYSFDEIFDYSTTDEFDLDRLFDSTKYYQDIDSVFSKYSCNPEINLYAAMRQWKDVKSDFRKEDTIDRLFNYYTRPTQTLMSINNYLNNRIAVNNISTAILQKRNPRLINLN